MAGVPEKLQETSFILLPTPSSQYLSVYLQWVCFCKDCHLMGKLILEITPV